MQINIRRGLIRAWIAGSVLWLGFGIVFLRPLAAGDLDGLAVWKRILRAIEELRAGKRPEGAKR